jgi:hypothetical protein
MCALIRQSYKINTNHAELPKGEKFQINRASIKDGQLAPFQIGSILVVGRMFENYIIQPKRWIDCENVNVRAVGGINV